MVKVPSRRISGSRRQPAYWRYGTRWGLVNMALAVIVCLWAAQAVAAAPLKILMLGDSLTVGYGLVKGKSVPDELERALNAEGFNVTLINAGVSGDTSAGGRSRLAWAMAGKPQGLIIELGANDGLRGLDPKQTRQNLDAIIAQAKAAGVAVLLTGMLAPPNLGPEYGQEFNQIYGDLARRHEVALYPFFLQGVAAIPELNQPDGLHPNEAGVAVVVKNLLGPVKKLIAEIRK